MQKIRLTKTLLDSWLWVFKKDDGYESFLKTLNREKTPPTEAMLLGQQFENCVNNVLLGEQIPNDHPWKFPILEMADYLSGSQQQVNLYADIDVDGQPILLHGVLDYLRSGVIYDCKFSKNYHLNKYLWEYTSQTGVYLALVPEARRFEYLISDGEYLYKEKYPREIVPSIEITIRQFLAYMRKHEDLNKILFEKWRAF